MTWQGVSEAECYDNRSVMAQIMRLKDRVRALEEGGDTEIERQIELINEELTLLEARIGTVETSAAGTASELDDEVSRLDGEIAALESGKADKTQLTDGSVTKIGTATVGSQTSPIYINNGTPTTTGVSFIHSGPNDIGIGEVKITNSRDLASQGTFWLEKADLRLDCDQYYRRWDGYNAGSTSMWGWEIPIQNDQDNPFEMEIDVICDGTNGTAKYSRFRLATNGAGAGDDPKVPPVLEFDCLLGDASMMCVSRLTTEHWTTDFTVWNVFVAVNRVGSEMNRMPAVRINHVKSKKKIYVALAPDSFKKQYENVTYSGNTIPNVTNYMYYDWLFPREQGGGSGGEYYAGTGLSLASNTFSLSSATQSTLAAVAGKADDSTVVKLAGAQTITGAKIFTNSPVVPTPTTDYQVATKKYVDDNAGGSGGTWTTVGANDFTPATLATLVDTTNQTSTFAGYALKDIIVAVKITVGIYNRASSVFIPKGAPIYANDSSDIEVNVAPISYYNTGDSKYYKAWPHVYLATLFSSNKSGSVKTEAMTGTTSSNNTATTIYITDLEFTSSETLSSTKAMVAVAYRRGRRP